ncbi:unnamed protein product [Rhizopus stolonifer]
MSTTENSNYKFNYEVNRDLVYYFDENQVETIYTQPGTNRKTRHHFLVANLSIEKLWIKQVLNCRLYGEPRLLIVCRDSTSKIYFFWYCVITKTSKVIDFETPVVGDITQAKITKAPFEVNYVYKAKVPEKKMCYALVLGMQDGSSILFLLNIDHLSNISVSFKYLDQEEGDDIGHVTSIYILPQDADDKRMGHHDPQILLGYSKGAIRAYRFRATVYSFKASRIRSPIDLSEFTEFPGYPITHLSCARTYNSLKFIVSFAQEKPNDPKFENAQSYVKLIEFNGTKKDMLKLFHPPIPSASIAEAHLMSHYEDDIDFTIVFYSSLSHTFTISVWYLDNKQAVTHTLEKEITQSSCLERLESTERTEPDDHYLLRNPEKVIEFAFPSQAVGLKRKATVDFFKESLEALELPNKRERLLHKNSPLDDDDDEMSVYKNEKEEPKDEEMKDEPAQDETQEEAEDVIQHDNHEKEEQKEEGMKDELAQDGAQEKTDDVTQHGDVQEETDDVIHHDRTEAGDVSVSFEKIEKPVGQDMDETVESAYTPEPFVLIEESNMSGKPHEWAEQVDDENSFKSNTSSVSQDDVISLGSNDDVDPYEVAEVTIDYDDPVLVESQPLTEKLETKEDTSQSLDTDSKVKEVVGQPLAIESEVTRDINQSSATNSEVGKESVVSPYLSKDIINEETQQPLSTDLGMKEEVEQSLITSPEIKGETHQSLTTESETTKEISEPLAIDLEIKEETSTSLPKNSDTNRETEQPLYTESEVKKAVNLSLDTESEVKEDISQLLDTELEAKEDISQPLNTESEVKEEINDSLTKEPETMEEINDLLDTEIMEEIKEPLLTESEIMEEIMEPLYAESQVMEEPLTTESDAMEEIKESFTTETKEQSDMEAIETHIDKQEENSTIDIDISENNQGSSIRASQIDPMSLDKSQTWMDLDSLETEDYMEEDGSLMIVDNSFIADESKDKSIVHHDEEMLDENDSDKQDEDNEYADLIEDEIEENDQEYEDERALDTGYAEEVAEKEDMNQDEKEQTYLDSLVFQDGDQDDEKEISGEETIDEESKEKEEGFVTKDEKENFESGVFLQEDPFVDLIEFENNEIRDEELKEKETDGEAVDGSVFSQDEQYLDVPEYEEDLYEQDTEDIQTSENREYNTEEEYSHVRENINTNGSPQVINLSDEEPSDNYDEEREYNDVDQNDSDSIPEYDEFHETTRVNEDDANEDDKTIDDDEDENKHRETFENGDEFEGYQEDQIKENYDEYLDAEEGYDEMENDEETEKEVENIVCLSDTPDQSQNVSVASEVYPEYDEEDYVDYPGEEENFPMDYDYDYDEYSSAIEEDDDEQKIEPQNGSINLISDSDDEEMDKDDNSSAQLLDISDKEEDKTSSVLGSVEDNQNTSVKEIVIQGPAPVSALAKLVASYSMDFYKWGRRKC